MTALGTSTLICGAMPFGYGPAAKLLAIARELRGRGLRLILTGRGIALELASRNAALFDDVVPNGPRGVRAELLGRATGALAVMDRDLAEAAALSGTPLYVVDSLLWMRDQVPPALRGARRYWAQDFIGFREIQAQYEPAPSIVGPILPSYDLRRERASTHLLVNLGGCESPGGADANAGAYAEFVVAGLLNSAMAARFAGRITIMAGSRCIQVLHARHPLGNIELVSLSHEDAIERLARAAFLLTSPGLTMTLESFQHGVPAYFLPPQNYSQWCALRLLRGAGLAPHALHWEDLNSAVRVRDRAPESERNPIVRAAVAHYAVDIEARARFGECLDLIDRADHGVLAAAQGRFFASLGANGARTIAREIAADLLTSRRRDQPRSGARAPRLVRALD